MSYTYTNGDGLAALTATEPANTDQIATSCAQSIRQIKAYLKDTTASVAPYTKNATDAAIAAAIASAVAGIQMGRDIFKATPSSDQDIVVGGAGSGSADVAFGTEEFDPDGHFASSIFTAPANGYYEFSTSLQVSLQAGSPTNLNVFCDFVSSAGQTDTVGGYDDVGTGQRFIGGSTKFYLTTGQTVKISLGYNVDAGCTIRVNVNGSYFSGVRLR